MSSMSFATPGMTGMRNDYRPSHMQTQQPFFSNAGQIDFKYNVKISHDLPMASDAVGRQTDTTNATTVYLPLDNKDESIIAKLTPLAASTPDSVSNSTMKLEQDASKLLTVEENSKRLARMICEKMGHANASDDYTGTLNSKFSDPFATDKFKLLVHEFIEAGQPDFHTWLQMNPERGELPSIVVSGLYKELKTKVQEMVHEPETPASPETPSSPEKPKESKDAQKTDSMLAARVGRLEKQQSVLSSATLNNNEVIRHKIGHIEKALQMHHSELDKHATKLSTLRTQHSLDILNSVSSSVSV